MFSWKILSSLLYLPPQAQYLDAMFLCSSFGMKVCLKQMLYCQLLFNLSAVSV